MAEFSVDYEDYFKKDAGDFLSFYDEVDIVDFSYHPSTRQFTYPCPCGDLFIISLDDIKNGETVARCPSCSLLVIVVYGDKDIVKYS